MTRVAVSGIRHVTHAIYIASWCRRTAETNRTSLTVWDHDESRHLPELRRAIREVLSGAHISWADCGSRERPDYYVAVGIPGVKPWIRLGRPSTTVSVDEGLSSYGDARSRFRAMRREAVRLPTAVVRSLAGSLASRSLRDESWLTFHWAGSSWQVNEHVADEFRRRRSGVAGDPDRAVYLAQPWIRLGVVSAVDYRSHLARVRSRCERDGLRLIVRPHHSDDPTVYDGFDLVADPAPAEITAAVTDAPIVIGEHSGGLVNLAAFGPTPTRRVASPAEAQLAHALSDRQRSLLDQFLSPAVEPEDLDLPS